jgi:hypothetical protein
VGGIFRKGPAYLINADRRPEKRNNLKINPI